MRRGLGFVLALGLLLALVPSAHASFHLMKISEIGQGGGGSPDYVELQMYAPGQNLVAGKFIRTYDETGGDPTTFTFPSNVPSGESQRTILVSRDDPPPPGNPDFASPDLIVRNSGAVCFGGSLAPNAAVDCVSYGGFAGVPGGNPSPVGAVARAPAPGQALQRSITANCSTSLDALDDTDDSAADFALAPPSPRPNSAAPATTPCPETTITKGPKRKVKTKKKRKKATIHFASNQPDSTFECSLDGEPLAPCVSPVTRKVKKGEHTFSVRAANAGGGVDQTPAELAWKVKRKKPKK